MIYFLKKGGWGIKKGSGNKILRKEENKRK